MAINTNVEIAYRTFLWEVNSSRERLTRLEEIKGTLREGRMDPEVREKILGLVGECLKQEEDKLEVFLLRAIGS